MGCDEPEPAGAGDPIAIAPGFVPPNDLRLATDSLCIDAGLDEVAAFNTDLTGNPRIIGAAADLGAYEHLYDHVINASSGPNGALSPSGAVYPAAGGSQ
jgi:hypothetical protein